MIENLNKENFWNALHDKYPDAVDHFCKWIDEYKKEVNWDKLFAPPAIPMDINVRINEMFAALSDIPDSDPDKGMAYRDAEAVRDKMLSPYRVMKFHDLPFEMQTGILYRWEMELFSRAKIEGTYQHMADYKKEQITEVFRLLQDDMSRKKQSNENTH